MAAWTAIMAVCRVDAAKWCFYSETAEDAWHYDKDSITLSTDHGTCRVWVKNVRPLTQENTLALFEIDLKRKMFRLLSVVVYVGDKVAGIKNNAYGRWINIPPRSIGERLYESMLLEIEKKTASDQSSPPTPAPAPRFLRSDAGPDIPQPPLPDHPDIIH